MSNIEIWFKKHQAIIEVALTNQRGRRVPKIERHAAARAYWELMILVTRKSHQSATVKAALIKQAKKYLERYA